MRNGRLVDVLAPAADIVDQVPGAEDAVLQLRVWSMPSPPDGVEPIRMAQHLNVLLAVVLMHTRAGISKES